MYAWLPLQQQDSMVEGRNCARRCEAAIADNGQGAAAEAIECFLSYQKWFVQNPNTFLPVMGNVSGLLHVFQGSSLTLLLHVLH